MKGRGFLNRYGAALASLLSIALQSAPAAPLLEISPQFQPGVYPAGGGGDSALPMINADGRFILFASTANNLALASNNTPISVGPPASWNTYLHNRESNSTQLISVNLPGTGGGNGDSFPRGISQTGKLVLFESSAANLVANDTNGAADIFVRDLDAGTTTLLSANTNDSVSNAGSRDPVMTPDGRFTAFVSAASDLVPEDTNGIPDVFVRDRLAGTTMLASVGATAANGTAGSSEAPQITPDGRFVAFYSTATNLSPGAAKAGEVYVRDLLDGVTTWASTNARALYQSSPASLTCCHPRLSTNGNFVAFLVCTNFAKVGAARAVALRFNRLTGSTDVINTNANTPVAAFPDSRTLDMTPDGRFVAYVANLGNASGTNTAIYIWDAQSNTNILVSADRDTGQPVQGNNVSPTVSPDGAFVVFLSNGTNLAPNPLNNNFHLYRRDVLSGITTLVDVSTNGTGSGVNPGASLGQSTNGQWLVFESAQADLVPNNLNVGYDVYLRNVDAGTNMLVSAPHPNLSGTGPTLSWLANTNATYRVEFLPDLSGTNWGNVLGTITLLGKRGYVTDLAPPVNQKFYRAISLEP